MSESPRLLPATASFASLASAGWPAVTRIERDGWELRFASGVTRRANSARPLASDPDALLSALPRVEAAYAERGLPCVLQLSAADAALLPGLASHGYDVAERTLVLGAPVIGATPAPMPVPVPTALAPGDEGGAVEIADAPSEGWLTLWWAVDGRGGEAELAVARSILSGGPALYASAHGDGGAIVAVARLALVGEWGGLYCVATDPSARRRGHARRMLDALFAAGAARGVTSLWLQVLASNHAAQALYTAYGFAEADRYDYLTKTARR